VNLPAISAPKIAMARTPATRATALLMPEATPTRFSATELSAVAVSGATVADSPRPKMITPGSTSAT
jgi:hypothetical protein